jgi:magnesium transporter
MGLEPGTIVYVGDVNMGVPVKLTLLEYNENEFQEKEVTQVADYCSRTITDKVQWLNVDGVHQKEVLETIGAAFNLHPLVLEDVANTHQRPKTEEYDDIIFVVIKMLTFNATNKCVEVEQVSIVLGKNFLISFQEDKEGDIFEPIRERIRLGKQRIRKSGTDYLLYCLLDMVIDNYFVILENLGDEMNELEEQVISVATNDMLHTIYRLKREMILLRKSIWPMRELLSKLERSENEILSESSYVYYRDIYDHSIQAIETIEMYNDMLSGMLDIFLTSTSNHMNGIMKVLTIISTIFIPLTFIVGVYGMNFKIMPELEWQYGYLSVWVVMLLTVGGMYVYFRKKGWF